MQEELRKSLVDLIDETLGELDELKKSSRFAASEIKIEGPGDGIAGKPVNGSLGKEEDDKDEDDKDEDKDMDKAEGKNSEADPNAGNHQVAKEETAKAEDDKDDDDEEEEKKDDMDKAEGKNSEADPNAGNHQVAKEEAAKADMPYDGKMMAKSIQEANEAQEKLLKSYVDERFSSFEDKLSKMADMIVKIADAPVAPKGASYKDVQPLAKSADEGVEPLNKSQLVDKLFDLKKSGEAVDTDDIIGIETGGISDLSKIVAKYNIK